jgi:hypothetical protein
MDAAAWSQSSCLIRIATSLPWLTSQFHCPPTHGQTAPRLANFARTEHRKMKLCATEMGSHTKGSVTRATTTSRG